MSENQFTADLMKTMSRLTYESKIAFSNALGELNQFQYNALHRVYVAIHSKGDGEKVYFSYLIGEYDSPPAISRILRNLEKDGLIERFTDKDNRRKTFVRMTDEGIRIHQECESRIKSYGKEICEKLGEEKLQEINHSLQALAKAIECVNKERR